MAGVGVTHPGAGAATGDAAAAGGIRPTEWSTTAGWSMVLCSNQSASIEINLILMGGLRWGFGRSDTLL